MWDKVKTWVLSILVPLAIDILSKAIQNYLPEAKADIQAFFQGQYDGAVLSGNTVWQSVIVSIIAPVLGIVIVLAPESPEVLTPAEILAVKDELLSLAYDDIHPDSGAFAPYVDESTGRVVTPLD